MKEEAQVFLLLHDPSQVVPDTSEIARLHGIFTTEDAALAEVRKHGDIADPCWMTRLCRQ